MNIITIAGLSVIGFGAGKMLSYAKDYKKENKLLIEKSTQILENPDKKTIRLNPFMYWNPQMKQLEFKERKDFSKKTSKIFTDKMENFISRYNCKPTKDEIEDFAAAKLDVDKTYHYDCNTEFIKHIIYRKVQ